MCITTFFYLSCGGFGYAAFGDQTPGDLLTGFATYGPYWLIDLANACVILHLIGGYQVYIPTSKLLNYHPKLQVSQETFIKYS